MVVADRGSLEKWKAEPTRRPKAAKPDHKVEEPIPNRNKSVPSGPDRIADLLDRFRKSMTSVHSLISFTSAISPAMSQFFIDQKLLVHARKHLHLIEDETNTIVYGLSHGDAIEMRHLFDEFEIDRQGLDALPNATLLSLVATFNSYFSEIVRFFLSIHPERYTESDKPISLKELFTRKSLEEVVNQVIDNEIDQLMRGSHTEQVRFLQSHLDVKIVEHYERWPKKLNDDVKCREVISSVDWTASGDKFQICIAALKGEVDTVVALMPGLAASTIKIDDFREWPVFDWIRDDPRVIETFERVYGEPMRSKVPEAATDVNTSEIGDGSGPSLSPDEPTRH